jgi:hypothetical protein
MSKHVWDTLYLYWIDVYISPLDYIIHDTGTNFISKEFQQYTKAMGITTKAVLTEAY